MSVTEIKEALSDELDVGVPDVECDYERWHQKKQWLENSEDVALMYQKYKNGDKFFCGVKGEMKKELISKVNKVTLHGVIKHQMRDDQIDTINK